MWILQSLWEKLRFDQGTLTLILKGEVSVRLTSLYLLVRNQLFQDKLIFFFHFQNNLVLTGKDKEVNRTDTWFDTLIHIPLNYAKFKAWQWQMFLSH